MLYALFMNNIPFSNTNNIKFLQEIVYHHPMMFYNKYNKLQKEIVFDFWNFFMKLNVSDIHESVNKLKKPVSFKSICIK